MQKERSRFIEKGPTVYKKRQLFGLCAAIAEKTYRENSLHIYAIQGKINRTDVSEWGTSEWKVSEWKGDETMFGKKEKSVSTKTIVIAASAVAIIMTAGIAAVILLVVKGKE